MMQGRNIFEFLADRSIASQQNSLPIRCFLS